MSKLFQTTSLNSLQLKNRFVRSATWAGMAGKTGESTPELARLMTDLAHGQVGLIVTGHAYVEKRGQASPFQLGIHEDRLIPGLKEMTAAVHDAGGKIALQLAHSGITADPELTGHSPRAVSAIDAFSKHSPEEMNETDLHHLATTFGKSADRAKQAGFDAVQIHAAHGYLLSQSISPWFNKRTDAFGGSPEKRTSLLKETVRCVREAVGTGFPVLIKMNTRDHLEGGLALGEAVAIAAMLRDFGIDAIELSGGTGISGKKNPVRSGVGKTEEEAYFKSAAQEFRKAVSLPLMLVGGIRSIEVAEQIVANDDADYISMSRPFIREPALVARWMSGDREKSRCISDNRCFVPARTGKGLHCVQEKRNRG